MVELRTEDALRLFEICSKVAARVRVDDEDDRHDFALHAFENFFAKERAETSTEYLWAFAQATISGLIKTKRKRELRMLRESACVGEDGDNYFELLLPFSAARQETAFDAAFWADRIDELPEWHRETIATLADGGTPLDLCANGARPADVLKAAGYARAHVREAGARKQLERARWPDGPECPECSSPEIVWARDKELYRCCQCHSNFGVLSKTTLSVVLRPWDWRDASHRLKRPLQSLCQMAELVRDGASPSDLEARFETPYMFAFEVYNALRSTPWTATLIGMPLVETEPSIPKVKNARPKTVRQRAASKQKTVRVDCPPPENVSRFGEWEPEELNVLRNRWEAGRTGLEIAKELGRSRNSILGKVHRLGLLKIERAA